MIKNLLNVFVVFIFYFIKSETTGSFVNHFDGHFSYLKTVDFSFTFLHDYNVHYTLPIYVTFDDHGHRLKVLSDVGQN